MTEKQCTRTSAACCPHFFFFNCSLALRFFRRWLPARRWQATFLFIPSTNNRRRMTTRTQNATESATGASVTAYAPRWHQGCRCRTNRRASGLVDFRNAKSTRCADDRATVSRKRTPRTSTVSSEGDRPRRPTRGPREDRHADRRRTLQACTGDERAARRREQSMTKTGLAGDGRKRGPP